MILPPAVPRPVRRRVWLALAALSLLVTLAGCTGRTPMDTEADRLARSQHLIDSGNDAYRHKDYGLAARRYAAAAVVKTDDPAAYFGLGMALTKLGRDEDARAAYAKARDLAQLEEQRKHSRVLPGGR